MSDYLLKTKIFIPPLSNRLVSRSRLLEKLDTGLQPGVRLILISAPAGFGKSTLAAEWISSVRNANNINPIPNFCWLSLDWEDDDPTRFLIYFIACIEALHIGALVEPLTQIRSSQLASPKAVLASLINPLAGISGNLVLVLDDYHAISNPTIHEGLVYFLDHLPSNIRLALTTRADPPFPLARFRARGQMLELRSVDLRFDLNEADKFLNNIMLLNLKPSDLQELENHTEGWITGLHLAALSIHGQADPSHFIATFTGNSRFVLDYLLEEVLRLQSESIQEFLLNTSVLERMNGALCDALLDQNQPEFSLHSSQAILDQLEQNNLFIIALDDQHQWYRYHHLFADFLLSRLLSLKPDLVAILHQRASKWFEQNNLPYDAVHHTLMSSKTGGDGYEEAVRLIEKTAPGALQCGEINLMQNWLHSLPEQLLKSRPILCVYYAWMLVFSGPVKEIQDWIFLLELWLKNVQDAAERNTILNNIEVLQLFVYLEQGNPMRTFEFARQAINHLPANEVFLLGISKLISEMGFRLTGEESDNPGGPASASVIFSQPLGTNSLVTQLSSLTQAVKLKMEGHLHQAERHLRLSLQLAESAHQTRSILPSMAYAALSDLLCERNDLDTAERYARKILLSQTGIGRPELLVDGYLSLARIHRARGDADGAMQYYTLLSQYLAENKIPWFDILVEIFEVRLAIQQKNLYKAEQWAAQHVSLTESILLHSPQILQLLKFEKNTLVRVLLAQGKFSAAESIERELISQRTGFGLSWIIEGNMLLALALAGQERNDEAVEALCQALIPAEQEGFVRIFLDEGELMTGILRMASFTPLNARIKKYIDALLLFSQSDGTSEPGKRHARLSMLDPLSEREVEVLNLIAAGFSNRMIAERLYLAESTVKSHINHIYTKLGAASRTQAVARARELSLIS